MATIVQQIDYSLGEVDEILFNDTSQQAYLQALGKCRNAYVGSHRIPKRRPSFEESTLALSNNDVTRKTLAFEAQDGTWYALYLLADSTDSDVDIYLVKYEINTDGIRAPSAEYLLATDTNELLDNYDFTATDNYIVIANPTIAPRRVTIDTDDLTMSTIEEIQFSVVPSLDLGDISYDSYTFEPKCTSGGDPSGDPPVCPTGEVFGAVIDVTRAHSSQEFFTDDWIGGLIVGQTGASAEQPIGFGLIDSITKISHDTQRFTVTVLQAFGTENFTTSGEAWSVRKPVWGLRGGTTPVYPAITTFFKGRLWFANTPENPMLIAGSRENTPNDFNVGSGEPPDAIAYLSNDSQGGGIIHIFGGKNLHMFTPQKQLTVQGGLDVGIDAGNFSPQVTGSYFTSNLKPVVYRDGIYFTTSDEKGLIKITEDDRSVSSAPISSNHATLIRNPSAMAVVTIPDTQDQVLTMLNEDKTLTVYSEDSTVGVNAFSLYNVGNVNNESTDDLFAVDNRLHITSSRNRYSFASDRVDFDYFQQGVIVNGILQIDPSWEIGQEVQVTYETTADNNTNDNYLGVFTVQDGNTVDVGDPSLNADARYGKQFVTIIETLPLYSSAEGSFLKRRATRGWCQFFESYSFTVNGKLTALQNSQQVAPPATSPYRISGLQRFGFASGYQLDTTVVIRQETPYPVQIQKLAWAIEERVIV